MGPSAVAVGGGHVTAYAFSFALHCDFPPQVIQPLVIVSFWNAPLDPVLEASDPVVDPLAPVSLEGWLFDPITLTSAGEWAIRTPLIDLEALGADFDLDETYYVEIFPVEWAGTGWVYDPDVHAVFTGPGSVTVGVNQDHMWSDRWVRYAGAVIHYGDGDGFYDHPDEMDVGGFSPYLNQSGIKLVGDLCPGATLELGIKEPDDICVKPGDPVTVTLSMSCIPGLVRGYQAFLEFDTAALTFGSGAYTSEPFGLPIISPIAAVGGDIDLAAGINNAGGQSPTSTSADLVTLNFTVPVGATEGPTTVDFRAHDPPTRFSSDIGVAVATTTIDSPSILVDGTPPVITYCPPDMTVNADAGACDEATGVDPGWATATDIWDPSPMIEYKRSDRGNWNEGLLDPYPVATTTITWRATDCAGNYAECDQTVQVSALNELVVDVDLEWSFSGTRCITFELWECGTPSSVPVDEVMTFAGGSATNVTVLVPCGSYTCITARDKLHTLRRTLDMVANAPHFRIDGTQYVADFVTPAKDLIGGNLNDDFWIDILDFGVFSAQWGRNYGTGNTTCTTPRPHADITGDGLVTSGDFTFIQINFLKSHEANCCNQPGDAEAGPVIAISVEELRQRGLGHLAAGDLNGDGMLDERDIAAFAGGTRQKPRPGDLNGDGEVDFDDIDPFVLALCGEGAYLAQHPHGRRLNADVNGDGKVDFSDIDAFVALIGK